MTAYPELPETSNVIPLFPHCPSALADLAPSPPPSPPEPDHSTESKDFFQTPRASFEALIHHLRAAESLTSEHADLENFLDDKGTELLRQLFQSHLDLRAHNESRAPMMGADGQRRTHQRNERPRSLETLFGVVEVHRLDLSLPGHSGLRPMDAELNLPDDRFSFGVRYRVVQEVASLSFEEAQERLQNTTGADLGKRQIELLARKAVCDFEAFYETRAQEEDDPADLLVITTDAKGVAMHKDSLREATRKAAEASPKRRSKDKGGELKKNQKRMAQVCSVYAQAPHVRTPEEIVYKPEGVQKPRPKPKNKRVWASLERSIAEVVEQGCEEALRRDERLERTWVGLVDGNDAQILHLQTMAAHYGVELHLILDVIHVLGYLWNAAWCLHGPGEGSAETWVEQRLLGLLEGKAVSVAAGMRRSATMRGLSAPEREKLDECADYLLKYARLGMLKYKEFLAQGFPIATGVIEGACRYLVQDRMGLSGARWRLPGGEAVLKLRALKASGDLEAYWAFHRQQELQRNHLRHYDAAELPHLREAV